MYQSPQHGPKHVLQVHAECLSNGFYVLWQLVGWNWLRQLCWALIYLTVGQGRLWSQIIARNWWIGLHEGHICKRKNNLKCHVCLVRFLLFRTSTTRSNALLFKALKCNLLFVIVYAVLSNLSTEDSYLADVIFWDYRWNYFKIEISLSI